MLLEADRQHTLVAQKSAAPTVASVVVEFDRPRATATNAEATFTRRFELGRAPPPPPGADKLPPSAAAAPAEQPLPPAAAGAAGLGIHWQPNSAVVEGGDARHAGGHQGGSPAGRRSRSTASPSRAASARSTTRSRRCTRTRSAMRPRRPRTRNASRRPPPRRTSPRRRSRASPARPAADPAAGEAARAAPAAGAVTIEFRVPRAVARMTELRRPRDCFDEEGAALAEMEGFDAELEPSRRPCSA